METIGDAFPVIAELEGSVTKTGHGPYHELQELRGGNRSLPLSLDSEVTISCFNPKCRGGGFDLEAMIREMVGKNEMERNDYCEQCYGHEPRSAPCLSFFHVNVRIVLK